VRGDGGVEEAVENQTAKLSGNQKVWNGNDAIPNMVSAARHWVLALRYNNYWRRDGEMSHY
jgi:hypothetical protein